MAKKRLFQILDEMNILDTENNTKLVQVCPNLVSANFSKNLGTKITMGCPGNVVLDIDADKLIPVLVLVDKSEYDRLLKDSEV